MTVELILNDRAGRTVSTRPQAADTPSVSTPRPARTSAPDTADSVASVVEERSYGIDRHLAHVDALLDAHPGWSRGIAHLNALDDTAPDIALIVRGKVIDPTLRPEAEAEFVTWLGHLLDSPVGQSMVTDAA